MLNITATLQRSATSYLGLPSVLSVNGETGVVVLDRTDIGLPNVLNVQQEPALGNPGTNNYVLASTTSGVRSWILNGSGGSTFATLDFTGSNLTSIETRLFADLQSKPTTLVGYGITDAQGLDADLTSWASITRAAGFDTFATTPSGDNLASLLTTALAVSKGGTGLTSVGSGLQVLRTNAGATALEFATISTGLTVGTTAITSGTATRLLYETSGNVLGEISGATSDGTTLTLVAPVLGTPASGTLTNATGLPVDSGISGLGAGVATALAVATNAAGGFSPIDGTATFSGKTINLTSNTLTGTLAQFNTAVSDANLAAAGANTDITSISTLTSFGTGSTATLFNSTGVLQLAGTAVGNAGIKAATVSNGVALRTATDSTYVDLHAQGLRLYSGATNRIIDFNAFNPDLSLINSLAIKWDVNGTAITGTYDLGIKRNAAGVLEVNSGTPGTFRDIKARTFIPGGTDVTCSGGTIGTGSKNNAGFVTATTTGVSTIVITFTITAPTGWSVMCSNITNAATLIQQTAKSTTTATLSGTTASGDVIQYIAMPY